MEMIDWFAWNGKRCTDYGMHVLQQPSIVSPQERVERVEIPGHSGSLTLLEGDNVYDDINLSCSCVIDEPFTSIDGSLDRISAITGWLRGDGVVTFANRKTGYYKGRIANQISFDKIVRGNPHMSFSVQFQCNPYFNLFSGETPQIIQGVDGVAQLFNPGNVPSQPLLKIESSNEGTIMCGTSSMLISDLSDIGYMYLDCEAKVAYTGEKGSTTQPIRLTGTRVTGEWLTIPVGHSFFSYSGGIRKVTIIPRWRCI